ncbi:MAG: RnfABCDGE type electron transport complex subunit G [Clostridia bacterium]|nr:RnfABCDGE type electron transport complex subunit G [Clostridia bacterium]
MKKFSIGDILKPTIVLALICIITSALLAYTNSLTAPIIADLAIETEMNTRKIVLSNAAEFVDGDLNGVAYCTGKDASGSTVGYVFTTSAKGYGGDVKIMVGVNADGTVAGVQILSLSETPGLGMNATNPSFLEQFIGKTLGVNVNKNEPGENEIKALTGATITSKAVTSAVNIALDYYTDLTGGANNG